MNKTNIEKGLEDGLARVQARMFPVRATCVLLPGTGSSDWMIFLQELSREFRRQKPASVPIR